MPAGEVGDVNELPGTQVVITGGAGFIGSELTRQIAARGARVTIVDNLASGRRENIEEVLGDDVELEVGDIRDPTFADRVMRGTNLVFHLACLGVRHSIHSPLENHSVNASGSLNLLEAARKAGVRRFVYVSSSEVYGTARQVPMPEDHPTYPMTVYGASKLARFCHQRLDDA